MFAPEPPDPVFTVERRTVKDEAPLRLTCFRFLRAALSTRSATGSGGGGGAGGGTGSGILGFEPIVFILV